MKAMILAAGKGQRMLPLTNVTPKPLILLNNRYLIEYAIESLKKAGITEIIINIHHLASKIKTALNDGSKWGVNISYSEEAELLDTGGGIAKAINNNLLGPESFVVISADIISDFDFNTLLHQLSKSTTLAHLILVPNPSFKLQGDFSLNSNHIDNNNKKNISYLQLPSNNYKLNYTYAGIGIFDPKFFLDSPIQAFPLILPIKNAIKHQQITGEVYYGAWQNIGTLSQITVKQEH